MRWAVAVDELAAGTHACCRFDGPDDREHVLTRFIADGAVAGERILLYTRAGDLDGVPRDFGVTDLDTIRRSGQLTIGSAADAYFEDGVFDGEARAAGFAAIAEAAVAEGYAGVRVYADNGWMPAALGDPDEWLEYELRVAQLIPKYPLIGLCGFGAGDASPLSDDEIDAVHHQRVGCDGRPSAFVVYCRGDGSWVLEGAIDAFSKVTARRVLEAAERLGRPVVVDLGRLEFVDVGVMVMLRDLIGAGAVRVENPPALLTRAWRVAGLDQGLLERA